MHRHKKNRKQKGRKRTTSNKDARKRRNQLVKTIGDRKGVTSMKVAEKIGFAERPEPYTKLYRIVCFT